MNPLPLAVVAGLLMLAPVAAAEWYEGKPECPPDQFCTTSVEDEDAPAGYGYGYTGGDGKGDADTATGDTCMDGADLGEDCDDDVQYIGGDNAGGSNDGTGSDDGASEGDDSGASTQDDSTGGEPGRDAPALGAALALMAAGAAVAMASVNRGRR